MQLSEFDYNLPPELIAQTPIYPRDHSKLLVLDKDTGEIQDKYFYDLVEYLGENDVLVVNKTRVINARLKGIIEGGNECEIFLHKQINNNTWDCLVYPGKKLKVGAKVNIGILSANIKEISDSGRIVEFNKGGIEFLEIVEKIGETPLPPYIKEKLEDCNRYQTIYSKDCGSVAAPTAGLHFTPDLMEKLKKKGIIIEEVLLHVGLGTFKGVETENILEHKMHSELISIDQETSNRLNNYKKIGKNITAVGTTSVRTLESFTDENGILGYGEKETSIFIYPGYKWKFIDKLITNFHLPKSTLLMLVSALAGKENTKKAYEHAINHKYRFFSFGDAMFINN
nr:tRNA preQ1(34) S-adenosylmethionine ribosyltransferase-isomerase QueA [Candidatus Gracilibacteria bacterium]